MENQQLPQAPLEVFTPQPKQNYLKTIIFSVLVMITFSLIAYLIFQNQKLQKQVSNPPISPPVQTPSPTPKSLTSNSVPPDETAGWKTYSNATYNFSFKYPNTWKYKEDVGIYFGDTEIIDNSHYKISINIDNKDYLTLKNIFTTSSYNPRLININGTEGFTHSVISVVSKKNYKLPSSFTGDIIPMDAYESKITAYEALVPLESKTLRIYSFIESKDIVDQILSTFKFIDNKQDNTNLPSGWTYYKDSTCNVDIPIPPEKLDIDNRTWKTEIHSNYNLLGFFKGNEVIAIHRNPEEASGFISGMIEVACGQTNDSLIKLNSDFHSHLTLQTPQNTSTDFLIELTSNNDVTMWGMLTKEMTFVGGMFDPKQKYYLIVNSNKWYLITKKSDSSNPEINQQTNQIFDLLKFK